MLNLEAELNRMRLDPIERKLVHAQGQIYIQELVEREFAARRVWSTPENVDYHTERPTENNTGSLGVAVDLQPAARSSWQGVPILHYAGGYAGEPTADEAIKPMLLWLLEGRWQRPLIVENDEAGGRRVRWLFGDVPPMPEEEPCTTKQVWGARPQNGDTPNRSGSILATLLKQVRAGIAPARPGKHCLPCSFQDLCRHPEARQKEAER